MLSGIVSIALVVSGLMFYLAYYGFRYRQIRSVGIFSILMIAMGLHAFGYVFELQSKTLADALMWLKIQYVGISFYPLILYNVVVRSSDSHPHGYRKYVSSVNLALAISGFLTLFSVWLYPLLTGYYKGAYLIKMPLGLMLSYEYGPLYYLQGITLLIVVGGALYQLIEQLITDPNVRDSKQIALITAFTIPIIAVPIHILFRDQWGIDIWPMVFFPMALFFYYALKRYDVQFLSQLTHEMLLHAIDDMVIVVDKRNEVLLMNEAASRKGSPFAFLKVGLPIAANTEAHRLLNSTLQVTPWFERFYLVKTHLLPSPYGQMYIVKDETENTVTRANLVALARTDDLTQLFNRRYFAEYIETASSGYMVIMDVDYFKVINDTYGHTIGDFVLIAIAEGMRRYFPEAVKVRYGGEEFAMIIENTTIDHIKDSFKSFNYAMNNRLYRYVQASRELDDRTIEVLKSLNVTLSVGISAYESGKVKEAILRADQMLYQVKNNGRNAIQIS